MSTFLFNEIVYGPVNSRRLGRSLGVNLLPKDSKWCNYDCIYCECGWNQKGEQPKILPSIDAVEEELEKVLKAMKMNNDKLDVITFAGNGEPTMHPQFEDIIDLTIKLRDELATDAKISVLTNATGITKQMVVNALNKVDNIILKLDTGIKSTYQRLNNPVHLIEPQLIADRFKVFDRKEIIQTMFLRGVLDDGPIDNTIESELVAWEKLVLEVRPSEVMIYTIDRDTPEKNLQKIPREEMELIAERIRRYGIPVQVSA